MADIKVRDKEYTQAANAVTNIGGKLASCMDEYCSAIDFITAYAIQDNLIKAALCEVRTQVLEIKTSLEAGSEKLKSSCSEYVSQIDAADTYLY